VCRILASAPLTHPPPPLPLAEPVSTNLAEVCEMRTRSIVVCLFCARYVVFLAVQGHLGCGIGFRVSLADIGCIVYGVWCMVYGVWCMVYVPIWHCIDGACINEDARMFGHRQTDRQTHTHTDTHTHTMLNSPPPSRCSLMSFTSVALLCTAVVRAVACECMVVYGVAQGLHTSTDLGACCNVLSRTRTMINNKNL
jgi:hypothetical protein